MSNSIVLGAKTTFQFHGHEIAFWREATCAQLYIDRAKCDSIEGVLYGNVVCH